MTRTLQGKTLFITGSSRGIGKAIGIRAAMDGANIVIAAKTAQAHPQLPGTIYTAAEQLEAAGGVVLPCVVDVRHEASVQSAVDAAIEAFGGIDILVNNASAITLTGTGATSMKRFDLMHQVNARGTYLCSKLCIPHLKRAQNPHILNMSPPLNLDPKWFENHVAFTMAKYGMSMCVLGMSAELASDGVAVNALWPRTVIATAAVRNLMGGEETAAKCRTTRIMADAAHFVLTRDSRTCTGNFFIDEDVLLEEGVEDLSGYAYRPGNTEFLTDFFL